MENNNNLEEISEEREFGSNERMEFAGFWSRFWATILDSLLLMAISYLLFDPIRKILGVEHDTYSIVDLMETFVGFIYYIWFTIKYGQTLGKMAVGIQVISQDGQPLTLGKVIYRETIGKIVSCLILFIGYLAVAFDPKKRAWHDRMARTYVVKRNAKGIHT